MSDENPKKENQKKENSFIRERIVPRKNAKKILFIVIAVVLFALIFGTVAGVAFSVSRDLFGRETTPTESPIVILPRGSEEWSDGEDILLPETDAPESAGTSWKCACGAESTGNFCPECGARKPV